MDPETSIRLRPKNVRTCYVCGPDNACGLQVAFLADGAHGSRAIYTARPEHEGWPGLRSRRRCCFGVSVAGSREGTGIRHLVFPFLCASFESSG
jgi:hypothetical protein